MSNFGLGRCLAGSAKDRNNCASDSSSMIRRIAIVFIVGDLSRSSPEMLEDEVTTSKRTRSQNFWMKKLVLGGKLAIIPNKYQ